MIKTHEVIVEHTTEEVEYAGGKSYKQNYSQEKGELIRCKDCKHYQGLAECELIGTCMGTLGYCAWGKRNDRI